MQTKLMRKPEWLQKKVTLANRKEMDALLSKSHIHTVCQEAMCPNISECFSQNQATFLIMGNICTRGCNFCNITKSTPFVLDPDEPSNVADTVKELGLKHVVITSPTRDDLTDGGAEQYCKTVRCIKDIDNSITVELLIPDMQENRESLEQIAHCGAKIIGHNLETVPRLYHVRKGSDYARSLKVLKTLSFLNPYISTKSGIMLGLGERNEEVLNLMQDLLDIDCRLLSIGQYLAPSSKHAKVVEYVEPARFEFFYKQGLEMGFRHIKSSPYTRSSYMAHEYLE